MITSTEGKELISAGRKSLNISKTPPENPLIQKKNNTEQNGKFNNDFRNKVNKVKIDKRQYVNKNIVNQVEIDKQNKWQSGGVEACYVVYQHAEFQVQLNFYLFDRSFKSWIIFGLLYI